MALTYRSSGAISSSLPGTSAAIPKPSGLAVGDLMISMLTVGQQSLTGVPIGFTLLGNNTNSTQIYIHYKIADSFDVAASTFTFSWGTTSGYHGTIHAFSGGHSPTSPIQQIGSFYTNTVSSTTISIPSITTTSDNTTVLLLTYANSTGTFTPPTGPTYTEHYDATSNTRASALASCLYATSGSATGPRAYNISSACTYRAGVAIGINPSSSTYPASGTCAAELTASDSPTAIMYPSLEAVSVTAASSMVLARLLSPGVVSVVTLAQASTLLTAVASGSTAGTSAASDGAFVVAPSGGTVSATSASSGGGSIYAPGLIFIYLKT